jgi:hypothetical protein
VVVAAGATETLVPVTVPTPWSIEKLVALDVVHARTAPEAPVVTGAKSPGVAVKVAIVGGGITVTVTVAVTAVPAALTAVKVYVVVLEGVSVTLVPVTAPTPLSMVTVAAPVTVQDRVTDPPTVMVDAEAVKLGTNGIGATVTVTWEVVRPPPENVAVMV